MGVCYTAILLDEHDWNYCDDEYKTIGIINKINSHRVFNSASHPSYGMIVFECEKFVPCDIKEELKNMRVIYDAIYFISDNNLLDIFQS